MAKRLQATTKSKARRWNLAALVVGIFTAAVMLFAPLGSSSTEIAMVQDEHGARTETVTHESVSLLENEGVSVLAVMALPVVFVAAPLAFWREKHTRRALSVATTALGVFIVLGMVTVGLFFLPTFLLMLASVLTLRRHQIDEDASSPSLAARGHG